MKARFAFVVMAVLALGLVADLATAQKAKGGGKGGGPPANPNVVYTNGGRGIHLMDTLTGETGKISARGFVPAWSPDGSQIAYRIDGDLVIRNTDGSGSAQYVTTFLGDWWSGIDWSRAPTPNGRHMLIYGELQPQPEMILYAIELDGTGKTTLVDDVMVLAEPRWSPTGDRFICRTNADQLTIYTVGLVGNTLATVGAPIPITSVPTFPWYAGHDCDWSNDGNWIVVRASGDLWIIDAANPAISHRLTFTPNVFERFPSFDASDTRIFFIYDNDRRLYSIDARFGGTPVLESTKKGIWSPRCRRN